MPPRRPPAMIRQTPVRLWPTRGPVRPPLAAKRLDVIARRGSPALPTPLRRAASPPVVPIRAAVPPSRAAYRGPDPYVDFQRDFTDEGGIRLTFKIKDVQAWRTAIRVVLWFLAMTVTLWFAVRGSPFPMEPRCALRACPESVRLMHFGVNLVLLGLAAAVYHWILFRDDQAYTSLEIRPDCLIVDGCDTFWRAHMDLGWPQLVPVPDGSFVLRGVYGTREVDYVTLHAFDDKDRAIQVLGAHLQFAMQQLWAQPGGR